MISIEGVVMRIPGFAEQSPLAVIREAIKDFLADDMMTYAAALAYRILLALFPFIIFLLTLFGALGLSNFFDWLLTQARVALPGTAFQLVEQVIGEISGQPRGGVLSFSILFALWAASTAVRSIMNALNVAYDVKESRPAWKLYPLSLIYTIGLAVLLIAAAGFMLLGPNAMQWLAGQIGLSQAVATLWTILRWPVAVLLLLLTVAVIYKVAPNIDQPFKFLTPGAAIAVLTWILASLGFSYYVGNFANYGATYGSLGGIVILLFYFFISAAVLLFGAEINATILPAEEAEIKG
ncbi:MAG TPA: YihY/virulence factor BrkB family protein [Thermomicrobiales bacterium]|nr:YihY/virulence factor BrkB family protein [Thermomicrobiales bacterium]